MKWFNIGKSDCTVSNIDDPGKFNFVNSVPKVIAINNEPIVDKYLNTVCSNIESTFNFSEVTTEHVEKILHSIKSNAKWADGLDLKMKMFSIPYLSNRLTFVINDLNSVFRSSWKMTNIIPIPKNSFHFRSISILPTLSKILEKIVHEQLSQFLLVNKVFTPTQSGFRPHHSTAMTLLNVTDDLYRAYDDKKTTCLLLLDFSKAFNTLNHATLCTVMVF